MNERTDPLNVSVKQAIYEFTEKQVDDLITCEEFYKAVKGPLKKTMKQNQKTSRLKHELQH